jgi:hypothetical protein
MQALSLDGEAQSQFPSTSVVLESAEKRKRWHSVTLVVASKGVASATDSLQP